MVVGPRDGPGAWLCGANGEIKPSLEVKAHWRVRPERGASRNLLDPKTPHSNLLGHFVERHNGCPGLGLSGSASATAAGGGSNRDLAALGGAGEFGDQGGEEVGGNGAGGGELRFQCVD